MKRVYLDYAAATPLDRRVKDKMEPYFFELFGNPSSVHYEGQEARRAVEYARKCVATLVHAQPDEIVFTSGPTESVNLALYGVQKKLGGKTAVFSTEHAAGLGGADTVISDFSENEIVRLLQGGVTLFSSLWTNNETGDVADIQKRAVALQKIRQRGGEKVFFHVDATQALGYEDISCERTPVDLLSFGSGKIYGPKGVGALFVRRGTPIAPLWHGGAQEHRLRPGTENVAGIVGFGEACVLLMQERTARRDYVAQCKETLLKVLQQEHIKFRLNGNGEVTQSPHIANITFFGVDAEELVMRLDAEGVACSAASACKQAGERSHVLRALGMPEREIEQTVRYSFGVPLALADAAHGAILTAKIVKRMLL